MGRMQFGDWTVEELLGQGGSGIVGRARDAAGRRSVAIKWLPNATLALREAFAGEVRTLRRVCHPGIAAILDHGETDGTPWLAMELVEGTTLRALLAPGTASSSQPTLDLRDLAAPHDPLPAPLRGQESTPLAALDALRALCEPLAWLHGEGMLHGDLKPENAMLRSDGSVVLLDLGLSRAFLGETRFELRNRRAGTLGYVAPEVIRGEALDGRVDLYSLGCMLYEACVGRPPFAGDLRTVVASHLHKLPELPSALANGVSAELEELILALLAKQPASRPAHADEVAQLLEAAGARKPPPGPRPRAALCRSRMFGREQELATLASVGGGVVCLVSGPRGIGRSRLLWELARGHEEPRTRSLAVHCRSGDVGKFAGAVQEACGQPVADPVLVEWLEAGAERSGPGGEARWRAVTDALLGGEAEAWLTIDDFHLAQEALVEFVGWAAAARPAGLRIVATVEMVLCDEHAGDVARSEFVTRMELGPLAPSVAIAAARDVLGEVASDGAALAVAQASAGNPRDLAVVARAAIDLGALVRLGGNWVVTSRVPSAAEAQIGLMADLVADEVAVAAAILGAFRIEPLLAAGFSEETVYGRLLAWERVGVLEGRPPRFASDRTRSDVLSGASPELVGRVQRRMLAAFGDHAGADPVLLGPLAAALGDPRAAGWLLESGSQQYAQGASKRALAAWRMGLASAPGPETAMCLWQLISENLIHSDLDQSYSAAEHAEAAARAIGDAWGTVRALRAQAGALRQRGEYDQARLLFIRSRELAGAFPGVERAMLSLDFAALELDLGRLVEAKALLSNALECGAELGLKSRLIGLVNLGVARFRSGDCEGAIAAFRDALALGDSTEEPVDLSCARVLVSVRANLAAAYQVAGRLKEARTTNLETMALARRLRAGRALVVAAVNYAEAAGTEGDFEAARLAYAEALVAADRLRLGPLAAAVRLSLFSFERKCDGFLHEALLEAISSQLDQHAEPVRARLACERGHLALHRGQSAAAYLSEAEGLAGDEPEALAAVVELRAAVGSRLSS